MIVYHAGSLTAAFTPVEQAFTCQTGVGVSDNTGGSVDLLRQVTAGGKPADVVASADYAAMDQLLKPAGAADYTVVFAHGRMVLAYLDSDVGPAGKNLPPIVDPNGPQFAPPSSIPTVVDNWHEILLQLNSVSRCTRGAQRSLHRTSSMIAMFPHRDHGPHKPA